MSKTARFAMREIERYYKSKGPSANDKKWMAINNMFTYAKECVKEREMELQRWEDAYERMEHIKDGGDPLDF